MAHATHAVVMLSMFAALTASDARPQDPPRLDPASLYESTPAGPRISREVEALKGRRVRVAGYMVRMEDAPSGAFYLTHTPIDAEEGGAGTGDLPPGALRIEVPRLAREEIAWVPDVIEVVGTLEVGRAEDPDGRVSWLRVIVQSWPEPAAAAR